MAFESTGDAFNMKTRAWGQHSFAQLAERSLLSNMALGPRESGLPVVPEGTTEAG